MSFYETVIKGVKTGFIKLVSTDPKTHMNFIVGGGDEDDWSKSAVTLTVDRVLKVRDALNEAYPPVSKPEPSEYKTEWSYGTKRYYVYQEVPSVSRRHVAACETEADAKKIAQALNEAEGL